MFGDPVNNPSQWESYVLSEVCSKITDGTHDTPRRLKAGVKFITGKHIRPYFVDFENSDYVSQEVHETIYKRCNPELGDILYTNIGVNLGTAAKNNMDYEFSMKNVALLKYNRDYLNGSYLEFMLNSPNMKKEVIRIASLGGAQKFLSLTQIRNLSVLIPPLALQNKFSKSIEELLIQKKSAERSLLHTDELFNSLLQKAFKGELV